MGRRPSHGRQPRGYFGSQQKRMSGKQADIGGARNLNLEASHAACRHLRGGVRWCPPSPRAGPPSYPAQAPGLRLLSRRARRYSEKKKSIGRREQVFPSITERDARDSPGRSLGITRSELQVLLALEFQFRISGTHARPTKDGWGQSTVPFGIAGATGGRVRP